MVGRRLESKGLVVNAPRWDTSYSCGRSDRVRKTLRPAHVHIAAHQLWHQARQIVDTQRVCATWTRQVDQLPATPRDDLLEFVAHGDGVFVGRRDAVHDRYVHTGRNVVEQRSDRRDPDACRKRHDPRCPSSASREDAIRALCNHPSTGAQLSQSAGLVPKFLTVMRSHEPFAPADSEYG